MPQLKSSSLLSLGQLCDDGCDVILNKGKLYAVKNKEVILQGFRNTTDSLWDIPVAKKQVQQDNYISPPSHAALYTSNPITSPAVNHLHRKRSSASNTYNHIFSDLEPLIDVNETHFLVDQQLKEDAQDCQLGSIHPKINVILRKKQPQLDLVTFLHGACFAPVTSTWVKAIKMGTLQRGQGLLRS